MLKLRVVVVFTVAGFLAGTAVAAERRDRDPRERQNDNWRRDAIENMHVAAGPHLIAESEVALYRGSGVNTMTVFDAVGTNDSGTAWRFKSEEQVRAETTFAREHGLPLILGMAVEPFTAAISKNPQQFATTGVVVNGTIPPATDEAFDHLIVLMYPFNVGAQVTGFPLDNIAYPTRTAI